MQRYAVSIVFVLENLTAVIGNVPAQHIKRAPTTHDNN